MKKYLQVAVVSVFLGLGMGSAGMVFAELQPEAGFCTLEELDFYFHTQSFFNRLALRSSPGLRLNWLNLNRQSWQCRYSCGR